MTWHEGEKVGGYILGKQLGQGGMATVYLAHHPQLDREVAIKVMHQNFLDDEGFVARFKREAQIVARLSHPHIVPVYDYDEHDGQPYLVMKYVQGWTLKKQFIKDPLDLDGVLGVITAIGDALNYAHEQGVLHRDIKPSNIVIDPEGIPYLTDFGLARLASSGESTMSADMLLGTPHYISPEQARGVKQLDGRTDIYSLGIVLYELLVGKVPFTGDSAFSIIHDHIYTALPKPSLVNPDLPPNVEAVLYKALEKQPNDRYETANDLVSALTDAIKRSNMTELDPNRIEIATESLAKIRAEYNDELTITPPAIGIGSPLPKDKHGFKTATMYQKQAPFYEQDRFWTISGCASLLIIVFVSFGILLGMSGNLQELAPLFDFDKEVSAMDISPLLVFGANAYIEPYREYGVTIETLDGMPYIDVPYVSLSDLPDTSGDSVISLLRAKSLYTDATEAEARQEVITHTPNEIEVTIVYYLSAAQIALEMDDTGAAVIYAILASEEARSDNDIFTLIRPITLNFIYHNVADIRTINLASVLQSIEETGAITPTFAENFTNSPITDFATARNLLANGNTALARTTLLSITEPNPVNIEYNLLRAELQIQLGNADNARSLLDGILEDSATPEWVRVRAIELQNQQE